MGGGRYFSKWQWQTRFAHICHGKITSFGDKIFDVGYTSRGCKAEPGRISCDAPLSELGRYLHNTGTVDQGYYIETIFSVREYFSWLHLIFGFQRFDARLLFCSFRVDHNGRFFQRYLQALPCRFFPGRGE